VIDVKNLKKLPTLTEEETKSCLERGKNQRMKGGFMAELSFSKELGLRGVSGAYASCTLQQLRNRAQKGADLLDIDVKSHSPRPGRDVGQVNLFVEESDLATTGTFTPADKFVLVLEIGGEFFFGGWMFRNEVDGTKATFVGKDGKRLFGDVVANLRPLDELLATYDINT